jgi:Flp pilus assembly protein TadD
MNVRTASILCYIILAGCAHGRSSSPTVQVKVALAHSLSARGQKEAAFEAADAACREAPEDGAARAIRGSLLSDRGLLDEAEADLQDAVRLRPDLAEAHSALAILHERRRRPSDAEVEHRRAAELAPADARYLNNYGYALLLHGKAAAAVPLLMAAARLDPRSQRIRNNLGFAYARLADYPRASHEFALGGTPAEAQNNLGFAYEHAGNTAQARAHYEEALRLDAGLSAARDNLQRVTGAPRPQENSTAGSVIDHTPRIAGVAPASGGHP